MKRTRQPYFMVIGVLLFIVVIGVLTTGKAKAATDVAISSQAPMLDSGEYYNDNTYQGKYRGWFAVASGTTNATTAWQKVYIPANKLTPTVITVTNGGGYCYGPGGDNNAYDAYTPEVNYSLQDLDANENMVTGGGTYNVGINSLTGGSGCRNLTFVIPPGVGATSTLYGHRKYKVFFFIAQMVTPSGCSSLLSCSYVKLFQLDANDPSALIGFSRSVNSATQASTTHPFGVAARSLYLNGPPPTLDTTTKMWTYPPYDWTYSFQFAPRCDEDDPGSQLSVYDADNGVINTDTTTGNSTNFLPQYLSADLYSTSRDVPGYNWIQQPGSPGPHTWSADQLGAYGQDLAQTTLTFPTNSHNRYRLHMNQFNWHNVIQFYVPLDQFDADSTNVNCFASSCNISRIDGPDGIKNPNNPDYINPPNAVVSANTGQTIHLQIKMTNTGAGPWTYSPGDPNTHFALGQRSPPSNSLVDFNKPPPPPFIIEPDEDASFDVYISSSTATSARYVYQMQDAGAKWFGGQCRVDVSITGDSIPPIQASCTQVGVRVSGSSVRTSTPTRVTFSDPTGGVPAVAYNFNVGLDAPDNGQKFFDPFKNSLGPQLYPHIKYDILLEVQADTRNPGVWSTVGSGSFSQQCLSPRCDLLGFDGMEVGDTTIGSSRKQTYGISLNNQTNQTYNPNIYLARIITSGGVVATNYNPGNPVSAAIVNSAFTDLNASFDVTLTSPSVIQASLQFDLPGGAPITTIDNYYPGTLACSANFKPVTRPYFKAFGGDVSAGGSFNTDAGSNNCIMPTDDADYGSIKASANSSPTGSPTAIAKRAGASTDFAAFLTGSIFADTSQRTGFYTGLPVPGPYSSLINPSVFANTGVPSWGGGFVVHCLYDYFGALSPYIDSWSSSPLALISDTDTVTAYKPIGLPINISSGSVPLTNRPTIIVNGDTVINQNIIYSPGWSWALGSPPALFTLVVKGNIYIDQAVSQLDGLYIAEPDATSGSGGQIFTCTDGTSVITVINNSTCTTKLTVNGSFIAQRVHLLRTKGTLRTAVLSPSPETYASDSNPNIAEQFNYIPEILMAAPTVINDGSSNVKPIKLDSIISLPPLF